MGKRISPEQRVEDYFMNCDGEDALIMIKAAELIVRARFGQKDALKPKRGRKPKAVELKEPAA